MFGALSAFREETRTRGGTHVSGTHRAGKAKKRTADRLANSTRARSSQEQWMVHMLTRMRRGSVIYARRGYRKSEKYRWKVSPSLF